VFQSLREEQLEGSDASLMRDHHSDEAFQFGEGMLHSEVETCCFNALVFCNDSGEVSNKVDTEFDLIEI